MNKYIIVIISNVTKWLSVNPKRCLFHIFPFSTHSKMNRTTQFEIHECIKCEFNLVLITLGLTVGDYIFVDFSASGLSYFVIWTYLHVIDKWTPTVSIHCKSNVNSIRGCVSFFLSNQPPVPGEVPLDFTVKEPVKADKKQQLWVAHCVQSTWRRPSCKRTVKHRVPRADGVKKSRPTI